MVFEGVNVGSFASMAFSSLPILLLLIGVIFVAVFGYMWKARMFMFKWRDAIGIPTMFNYEGGAWVPMSDKLRKDMTQGIATFESKAFGEIFDASRLAPMIHYVPGRFGRGLKPVMLPLFRYNGEWTAMDVAREPDIKEPGTIVDGKLVPGKILVHGKTIVKQAFSPEARVALATLRKKNDDFLADSGFWEKYGGAVSLVVMGVIFLGSLIVITQFVGSAISSSTNQLAQVADKLAILIEMETGCSSAAPTPVPPPRG